MTAQRLFNAAAAVLTIISVASDYRSDFGSLVLDALVFPVRACIIYTYYEKRRLLFSPLPTWYTPPQKTSGPWKPPSDWAAASTWTPPADWAVADVWTPPSQRPAPSPTSQQPPAEPASPPATDHQRQKVRVHVTAASKRASARREDHSSK